MTNKGTPEECGSRRDAGDSKIDCPPGSSPTIAGSRRDGGTFDKWDGRSTVELITVRRFDRNLTPWSTLYSTLPILTVPVFQKEPDLWGQGSLPPIDSRLSGVNE